MFLRLLSATARPLSQADNNIDMSVLEDCSREVLEDDALRAFAVLDPIKLTITNWPEGKVCPPVPLLSRAPPCVSAWRS